MSDAQNWRIEQDATDFFGHQKKQAALEKRRPSYRRASDIPGLGPSIGASAVRIVDFNDVGSTYNGYYSAGDTAGNRPVLTAGAMFVGFVVMDAEYGGIQVFTNLVTGTQYRRTFVRAPADPETLSWTNWV